MRSWRRGTAPPGRYFPAPGPGVGDRSRLHSVACSSPRWCVAVGTYSLGTDPNTLAERTLVGMWDGAGWSMVSSPNPTDAEQSALQSVTCISPVSCMAVGSYSTDVDLEDRQPLVERWQGAEWSVIPNPASNSELASVAYTQASSGVAVGQAGVGGAGASEWRPLVEAWRGTK
jgi:hypothetical protein